MTLTAPQRDALFALADGRSRGCWREATTRFERDGGITSVLIHRGVAHSLKRRGYVDMTFNRRGATVRITDAGLRLVHGSHQRPSEDRTGRGDLDP